MPRWRPIHRRGIPAAGTHTRALIPSKVIQSPNISVIGWQARAMTGIRGVPVSRSESMYAVLGDFRADHGARPI
jgi:hypothetical protein